MRFFKRLFQVAVPVVIGAVMPESIINTAVGAVVKHGTPIANNAIPYMNLGVSSAVAYARNVMSTGDWVGSIAPSLQEGGALMGMSTALHQALKIPMKGAFTGKMAAKIGPGKQVSI